MAFRESAGTPGSGIMMGMDGSPMMTGTWVNPKTGHKFTVQDCFFQDGNFMVQTTDGRMLDYNTIQHYVQTTDKGPEIGKQPQIPQKQQISQEQLPNNIMNEILPEDMEAINKLGNINDTIRNDGYIEPTNSSKIDPDVVMIEKVLKKHSSPKPSISIDWQPVPRKQIETLVDILGVEPQAIADYYIEMLDAASLMGSVKDAIISCVNSLVGEEQPKIEKVKDTKDTKATSKPRKTKK